jgi:hypothetical protein
VKKVLLILFVVFSFFRAYSQEWFSADKYINSADYTIISKAVYGSSTYILATYTGNITLGSNAISLNGTVNSILLKVGRDGKVKWYITSAPNTSPSTKSVSFKALSVDNNGTPYIIGWFNADASLKLNNSATDIYPLYYQNHTAGFIASFNSETGILNSSVKYFSSSTSSSDLVYPNNCLITGSNLIITGVYKGVSTSFNGEAILNTNGKYYSFVLNLNKSDFTTSDFFYYPFNSSYSNSDWINKIYLSSDNGYYLIGDIAYISPTFSINGNNVTVPYSTSGKYEFFILKTDKNLINQWVIYSSVPSGSGSKRIYSAVTGSDNNLALIGENFAPSFNVMYTDGTTTQNLGTLTNTSNSGTYDVTLLKIDKDGNLLNSKSYGTASNEYGRDIVAVNNKYAITGNFTNKLYSQTDTLTNPTSNQNGFIGLLDNNFNWLASRQINKTAGVADIARLTYNNLDMNYMIGTMYGSSATTSATATFNIKGATPYPTTLTTPVGTAKQMLIANSCPIIGIFETSTSNQSVRYINPSDKNVSLSLDVEGDVPGGYSYKWTKNGSAYATTSTITGLTEGSYIVTVSYRADTCSKQRIFSVKNSIKETSVTPTNPVGCSTASGKIVAVAQDVAGYGGNMYFSVDSVNWQTAAISSGSATYTFTGLKQGQYQLYYKNSKGDILKGSLISLIASGSSITGATTALTSASCGNWGITVSATVSGSHTLTYSKDGSTFQTSNVFTGLTQGSTYTITVKSDDGCYYVCTARTVPISGLSISSSIACYSSADNSGKIKIVVTGYWGQVSYSLFDSNSNPYPDNYSNVNNTGTFSNIAAGTYTVNVADQSGCIVTSPVLTLNSATPLSLSAYQVNNLCGIPGKLQLTGSNGNTPYTYSLTGTSYSQTQTDQWFENLVSGTYAATVTDPAGCSASSVINIQNVGCTPYPATYMTKN